MKNNKGFSLIELSIVLIILGILVAGVTGGSSLIKSAQIRATCEDFANYKNAYNAYYEQFGKRAGTQEENYHDAFLEMQEKGIITQKIDGGYKVESKLRDNYFMFSGINNESEKYIFDMDDVLLKLLNPDGDKSLSAKDAKSILKKIDDGKGNSGFVIAVNTENDEIADVDVTNGDNYMIIMRMDF